MEKFKEIHNYLNNTIELGSKILKKDISTILSKYLNNGAIYDYSIVCDNTNNPPHIVVNKLINIDVYFQKDKVSDTLLHSITIKVDEIKMLHKKRKKKLEKLNGI